MATAPTSSRSTSSPRRSRGVTPESVASLRLRADSEEQRLRLRIAQRNNKVVALGDYAAARRTRTQTGVKPKTTSADFQLDQWTADQIRAESQRLMRNSPLVRGMVRRIIDRAIGEGLKLQATTGSKTWNRRAEEKFGDWAESCADIRGMIDFAEMQRVALASVIVDGDVGFIKAAGLFTQPEDVLRLQAIEAQRIVSPGGAFGGGWTSSGTGMPLTVSGVELNADGRPVAYNVANYTRSGFHIKADVRRVLADDFIFLMAPSRFSQTRGEPRLASLITMNDGMRDYIESTLVAARVGASSAGFVKSNFPQLAQQSMLGGDVTTTDNQTGRQQTERQQQIQPGQIHYLAPGEEIGSFKPEQPVTQFSDFIRMLVRISGADLDLPLEMVLLDHSQSTAYAGRAALSTVRVSIGVLRKLIAKKFAAAVYRQVVGLMIASGQLEFRDDWESHAWIPPSEPSFEPDKEVAAAVDAIANNLTTKREVVAAMGRDLDEVLEQRAEEKAREAELGVVPPSMPGSVAAGAAGGDGADSGDPAAGKQDAGNQDDGAAGAGKAAGKPDEQPGGDAGGADDGAGD